MPKVIATIVPHTDTYKALFRRTDGTYFIAETSDPDIMKAWSEGSAVWDTFIRDVTYEDLEYLPDGAVSIDVPDEPKVALLMSDDCYEQNCSMVKEDSVNFSTGSGYLAISLLTDPDRQESSVLLNAEQTMGLRDYLNSVLI